MFVRVTENCNAGCFMCDYARRSGRPFMTKSQLLKIASEAKKAGIKMIRFTGGEPLLDPRTAEYIKYLHNQGFKTSLITNGFLLPLRAKQIAAAGLDQIIISLDSNTSDVHDRLRNLPGLFANATEGIKIIKKINKNIIVRINTVVSPHNIDSLEKMMEMLQALKVDQWSLIPIKGQNSLWGDSSADIWWKKCQKFYKAVGNSNSPKMLGYSKKWAGRNKKEAIRYFTTGATYAPTKTCGLVDKVRFYIPSTDKMLVCNCVPWRLREIGVNTDISLEGLNNNQAEPLMNYLKINGPKICHGCEPINAYLGENPEILSEDIFAF